MTASKRVFTKEHRQAISKACKGRKTWSKGKKMPKNSLYKNMASHIRFNVTSDWLSQFEDIEKLKFLNKAITVKTNRYIVDTDWYQKYIQKFYFDSQFNMIYKQWLVSADIYFRPTIDHIIPKAKGGTNDIINIQFLTWFENRCKNDINYDQWCIMKSNIHDYFIN